MVLYRRNLVPGGTYFFTVTLADRSSDRWVRHIGLLCEAFRVARRERSFRIEAIVVLPDPLHAVWTLPADDADYPGRWRRIKADFNPVKHGMVEQVRDWRFSSFHHYVRAGFLPADWAGTAHPIRRDHIYGRQSRASGSLVD